MSLTRIVTSGLAAAALALVTLPAYAGYISTPDLTPVFTQATFGGAPITVQWLPGVTLARPDLLNLSSDPIFNEYYMAATDGPPVVNAFFVDTITHCGGEAPGIVGCAGLNSNVMVLDSPFVAGSGVGVQDVAHELGHDLGLDHQAEVTPGTTDNLMNPVLGGSTTLTMAQVATILASPLVQHISGGNLIQIRPIAVVAAVPEPASLALLATAMLGLLGTAGLRRQSPEM